MSSKEPKTQEEEVNASVAMSLRDSGIGARYAVPTRTLADTPVIGQRLMDDFAGELPNLARSGYGVFIVGEGLAAYDAQMMVCRGFVLKGLATKVVSISYIDEVLHGGNDWMEIARAQVIGLRGWYENSALKSPMNDEHRFRFDMSMRETIERGTAFVLQAPVVPEECVWWSRILRDMVADRTALYIMAR